MSQAINWHPQAVLKGIEPVLASSGSKYRRHTQCAGFSGYVPAREKSNAIPEEPEGEISGNDSPGGEREEDSSGRSKSVNNSTEHSDEESDELEEPSVTEQNFSAAMRTLYDSFTKKKHPSPQSRTRGGRSYDQDDMGTALSGANSCGMTPPLPICATITPIGTRTSHNA